MHNSQHDAIVDMDHAVVRVQALSHTACDWIETHVTLEQVQTWTGSLLEVAGHYASDLVTGMLADGLKVATARGQRLE
jgi:hypothetical protein